MSPVLRVHSALVAVQVLFGLWPVAGAAVLDELSPQAVVAFRLAAGAPVLVVLAGLPWRSLPSRADLVRLALLAGTGISLNQVLYVEGLALAGPVNAGVVVVAVPALTLAVASAVGVERPGPARLAGVVVALLGAALLVGIDRLELSSDASVGSLLILGGAAAYAVFLVFARPVIARVGEVRAVAWFYVFGAGIALPFVWREAAAASWTTLSGGAVRSLAFILVGPTVLTYLLNAYALRRVESSVVAVYICLQPVVAAVSARFVLGAEVTLRQVVAATVISLGVAQAADVSSVFRRRAVAGP